MKTKEKQYSELYKTEKKFGRSEFGIMANQSWNEDPKRTLFTISRYKFVSKMFEGKTNCLEVGCADAFATRLVQQTVKNVTVSDFDEILLDDVKSRLNQKWPLKILKHDFVKDGSLKSKKFEAAYALDVLEHIKKKDENLFIKNIKNSLTAKGEVIFGMPSLESQKYASKQSKIGHVNCKNGNELKKVLKTHFKNVFIFSMNDEVIHTGFFPMSNYLLALCCK